jgi:cell division cycle protein 20 (cofactor of APC complex)
VLHDLFLKKSAEPVNTHNRVIPSLPEKILDAPELMDDYYLNLLDWSCSGQLAIGLNKTVYLYTPTEINELCKLQDAYVCSISFHPHTPLVSVGNSLGSIDLYDM